MLVAASEKDQFVQTIRTHTARVSLDSLKDSGTKMAPHSPYSLDPAPSDFYLFGYVKGWLAGCDFGNENELLEAVNAVVMGIEKLTL
jgi:hypothetical protein